MAQWFGNDLHHGLPSFYTNTGRSGYLPEPLLIFTMSSTRRLPHRLRHWVFTLFDFERWDPSLDAPMTYLVWQREKCPDTGRLHIQGYVEFSNGIRLTRARNLLGVPTAHLEPRLGSRDQARDYAMKTDTRDLGPDAGPFELGEFNHSATQSKKSYKRARDFMAQGHTLDDLLDDMPCMYARHRSAWQHARASHLQKKARTWRDVRTWVLWGPTRTGKTRQAHEIMPNAFTLNFGKTGSVWWDGCDGHTELIIDEFRGHKQIPYSYLLQILDGHTQRLDVKGSFTYALWTRVIITSNVQPELWYPLEEFNGGPLEARLHQIVFFGEFPNILLFMRISIVLVSLSSNGRSPTFHPHDVFNARASQTSSNGTFGTVLG